MSEHLLSLLSRTTELYQSYARTISRPALKQFVATIIDNEQRHVEELKEAPIDETNGSFTAELERLSDGEPSGEYRDDLSGLRMVCNRIEYLEQLFSNASALAEDDEASILLKQFAVDEARLRKLVEDRLELEALV